MFATSFIGILDNSLRKTPHKTAALFVIHQTYWSLWNQKNGRQYNDKYLRFLPKVNTDRAKEHLEAALRYNTSLIMKRRLRRVAILITPYQDESMTNCTPGTHNRGEQEGN